MKSVAVLQARTNSSRLPGKVLLPINGIPVVVLAARRAANTGRRVIVATSKEASDDSLASIVVQHGLACFRGSLKNTLSRIVEALAGYDPETIVFRLTADNVFPDGKLLDEIEQEFVAAQLDYIYCNGELSGLPYGLSAEATRLGHLRDALQDSVSAYDQEHVTPYVIRKFGATCFDKYRYLKKGHFRCTIDCLDDYLCLQNVFSKFEDACNVSPFKLMMELEGQDFQPSGSSATRKLVLGTAQLGVDYGIANMSGKPDTSISRKLIKTAVANGASFLDTAHAYGDSEEVIGKSLQDGWQNRIKIITKLSPLDDCPQDAGLQVINAFVDLSIYQSCSRLRRQHLDVLMLHRASHFHEWNGAVWHRLLKLKDRGIVQALGMSVQTADELRQALAIKDVEFIQMPVNILDWRWDALVAEIRAATIARKITIHARSTLLQGLLTSDDPLLWKRANIERPDYVMNWLKEHVGIHGRTNTIDLCINYVNSLDWIDGVVIGMETMNQLLENIDIFCLPPISKDSMARLQASRPRLSEESLNPALWRKD